MPFKPNFIKFTLPADRTLKLVINGITKIIDDEFKNALSTLKFSIRYIRRFDYPSKLLPIYLATIAQTFDSKNIFEINNLFFVEVSVEIYQCSGPSPCFACQRIRHSSQNYGHVLRCVMCAGNYSAEKCTKTRNTPPTCSNSGGAHSANYRGYVYLVNSTPVIPKKPSIPTTTNPVLNFIHHHHN